MSEAVLSVYRRADAYFLVTWQQTTAGVWLHVGEPPRLVAVSAEAAELGAVAVECLAGPRPTIRHPRQDEWADVRQSGLGPIMRSARVRSWAAFISNAARVDVARRNESYTVTPMKPLPKPEGAFEPDIADEQQLLSPSEEELGQAILRGLEVDEAVGP